MADELRLWLIRHAPVDGPRGVIHAPDAPADLTDTARLEALKAALPKDAPAWVSPARRTVETAQALGLTATEEMDFREQGFGEWTGRRHDDLAVELGPAYTIFWRAPARRRPPGGESFCDQIARVKRGIDTLPDGDAVLVVHSGTIRAALSIALDLAPECALRFVADPLSLTRLDRLAGSWRVGCVNRR
ncbi:Alpha-ribazole-5'-phosphate phosphatase [Rhodovulum sp. PH10]|uniref:histidine phosphatase family protein n=1 Tax=Rhodovulum sp. PH10 TaxID=1187851 RepID=UPI00027C2C9D|nr:histidine phosphatase family protein [Rhodovulum sp. PH10]EJW09976.1 Alpha-ribazole-5'-phosphate phosphatase [Rhodovulum sp. PH10]